MESIKNFFTGLDTTSWLAVIGIVFVIVFIIGYQIYVKTHRLTKEQLAIKKKKKQKYWNNMYQIMSENRIFKNHITRLTKRLEQMSVFRQEEIRVGVAKFTFKLFLYVVVTFVAGCFIFDDVISVALLVVAAYVIYQSQVEKSIQASVLRVYRELKNGISSVRLEYRKSRDVLVALENATYGNRVANIFSEIGRASCRERV